MNFKPVSLNNCDACESRNLRVW